MRTAFLALATFTAIGGGSAAAQTLMSFHCNDGSQFEVAVFTSPREITVQLDGKSLTLPHKLSLPSATRYGKGGVTITLKGQAATLKRSGAKTTSCDAD